MSVTRCILCVSQNGHYLHSLFCAVPQLMNKTFDKQYHIWTIGCQMNKADSDRLESALIQLGLKPVPTPSDADVIVLNS